MSIISTHTPREGRDSRQIHPCGVSKISTHTPREGRDRLAPPHIKLLIHKFQLTRPARGATEYNAESREILENFNSHAPRGARHDLYYYLDPATNISTHTPREGRDELDTAKPERINISTHTPREGRDAGEIREFFNRYRISTHTPREGRDRLYLVCAFRAGISTHTPREGRD